jgi:hypothetical protein
MANEQPGHRSEAKDGAPDLNRQTVKNTPYSAWYKSEEGRCRSRRLKFRYPSGRL